MNIRQFNNLDKPAAAQLLRKCCASRRWVEGVVGGRPFGGVGELLGRAGDCWGELGEGDYLEAFAAHPKIGDVSSLSKKYAGTAALAAGEQGRVEGASGEVIEALAAGNLAYQRKFGFIFIVCASGKSAEEMLAMLRARLPNTREMELANAAAEQDKITGLRIEALINEE